MDPFNEPQDASALYNKGLAFKSEGKLDAALTEFRRAVLADPKHGPSHLEIGLISKDRAKVEPTFVRFAYDAFRNAVKLIPENKTAHENYILLSRQVGKLDDVLVEYETLAKNNPDKDEYKQFVKTIVAISLAMVPQQVNVNAAQTGTIKKFAVISSVGGLMIGLALLSAPIIMKKMGKPMQPAAIKQCLVVGIVTVFAGVGGIVAYRLIK